MADNNGSSMISVENLTKRFGDVTAVGNISFNVRQGEVLGFLGPNGAGKTTTMKILTCFIPADAGQVSIAGLDIKENSVQVREKIGYLPENAPLYHDMGVIEYLRFVADMRKIDKDSIDRRIRETIAICGLESMSGKTINQLSKGFRQRVGLAQTMIHDPDILIMDEPTVGLDPNQIVEIRQLIRKIGKEKTVILSTHILSEVEATCDRVIIISNGALVADGTTSELIGKSHSGSVKITCKIRGEGEAIEEKLGAIGGVASVKKVAEEINQLNCFEVYPDKNSEPSEDIFFAVAKNGWSLTELKRDGVRLEDIFAKLTQGEA